MSILVLRHKAVLPGLLRRWLCRLHGAAVRSEAPGGAWQQRRSVGRRQEPRPGTAAASRCAVTPAPCLALTTAPMVDSCSQPPQTGVDNKFHQLRSSSLLTSSHAVDTTNWLAVMNQLLHSQWTSNSRSGCSAMPRCQWKTALHHYCAGRSSCGARSWSRGRRTW